MRSRRPPTALTTGELPTGFVRAIVDRVIPSIVNLAEGGLGALGALDPAELGHEHVRHTVQMLQGYSRSLAESIADGRVAIVGVEYTLADGTVHLTGSAGDVEV